MKLNRKIIIPAATLLVGVALAGSASSTIAWYQYSTRTNVAYVGTSAGVSGNLEIRINKGQAADKDWGTIIDKSDVNSYLASQLIDANDASKGHMGDEIVPITQGCSDKDDALKGQFYTNPVAGFGALDSWGQASSRNYVVLPLQLRYVERDGTLENNVDEKDVEKDVYLSDLTIQLDSTSPAGKRDISPALRIHFHSYTDGENNTQANVVNRLVSKNGGETATESALDLDKEPGNDVVYDDIYNFNGNATASTVMYGAETNGTKKQISYAAADMVAGSATNANLTSKTDAKKIGTTLASSSSFLNVTVTIWIEGWHALPVSTAQNADTSAIWSEDFIGSLFDVGMQFAI